MQNLEAFILTSIHHAPFLESLGNFFFLPARCLWHGRDVVIVKEREVHHVASFHRKGAKHPSRTEPTLHSSETHWFKTALAVFFLIPGLILGAIFKGMSYLSETTTAHYNLILRHFTAVDLTIGSEEDPLTQGNRENRLTQALRERDPLNQKITTLSLIGDGEVHILGSPAFERLHFQTNPQTLILHGAGIIHPFPARIPASERESDKDKRNLTDMYLVRTRKYRFKRMRQGDGTYVHQETVDSIEEGKRQARAATEKRVNGKPFHRLCVVKGTYQRPQYGDTVLPGVPEAHSPFKFQASISLGSLLDERV